MQNISRSSSSSTSSPSKAIFAQDGHRPSNHCIKTPTRPQAQLKTATGQRDVGHRPRSKQCLGPNQCQGPTKCLGSELLSSALRISVTAVMRTALHRQVLLCDLASGHVDPDELSAATNEMLARRGSGGAAPCLGFPILHPAREEHAANIFMVRYLAWLCSG